MDTLEVYTLNVQPRQIEKLLVISDRKPENIEKERNQFLHWLRDMTLGGAKFESQLSAWETYCFYIEYALFEDEEEIPEWEPTVVEPVYGNYEQRSRHGLPSQM